MRIGRDKWLHGLCCCSAAVVVGCLMRLAGSPALACVTAAVCGGLLLGLGKEYGDHAAPGNRWDWGDVVADLAGALCGGLGIGLLLY